MAFSHAGATFVGTFVLVFGGVGSAVIAGGAIGVLHQVRAGHHCAQPTLRHSSAESAARPSLSLYNTREVVDALVSALASYLEQSEMASSRTVASSRSGLDSG
ncbi:MAG: cysteine desulfurase / selenocysteine lyase [Solirubrobacteraceae bacterium]|jgi:cysteine desulfurase/selenocysteine lyase|nr:cysteine desulfurase / selenocysteine lyase [Solirubrobacteraceae bacterium]